MDELNFDGKTILVVGGPIGISLQRGLVAVSRYQLVSWVGGASIGMIAASTARRPIDLDGMACATDLSSREWAAAGDVAPSQRRSDISRLR